MVTNSARQTIELDAATADVVDQIRIASGLTTNRQVIDHALEVFHWVARERAHGARIVSIDSGERTVRELNLAVLNVIAENATQSRHGIRRHASRSLRRV